MKSIASLLVLLLSSMPAFSQQNSDSIKYEPVVGDDVVNKVFKSVDQMPEYQGGQSNLMNYLSKNIQYPGQAKEDGIQGKVIVQFVVCTDGSLCDEKIVRSVDPSIDQEVLRVVKAMPNWKPGRQNGQPVRTYYTLPVTFKLQDDEIDKVYESVEQTPEYPGGYEAMKRFISKNMQYPEEARKNKVHGTVILRYIVEVDGRLTDIQVLRSVPYGCSEEAVRLVKAFPEWNPGKQKGNAVRVSYTLPITFKL